MATMCYDEIIVDEAPLTHYVGQDTPDGRLQVRLGRDDDNPSVEIHLLRNNKDYILFSAESTAKEPNVVIVKIYDETQGKPKKTFEFESVNGELRERSSTP